MPYLPRQVVGHQQPSSVKRFTESSSTVRAQKVLGRLRALGIVMPTDPQQMQRLTNYLQGHDKIARMLPFLAEALQHRFAGRCTTALSFFRSHEADNDEHPLLLVRALPGVEFGRIESGPGSGRSALTVEIDQVFDPFFEKLCQDPNAGEIGVQKAFGSRHDPFGRPTATELSRTPDD